MTTKEIAERLAGYCREGKWEAAQRELYADKAISLEPNETPMFAKETRGLEAIVQKARKFDGMIEKLHRVEVSPPLVAANAFAFTLNMDITMKGQGRMQMAELCIYEVKDGKVVSERFFV